MGDQYVLTEHNPPGSIQLKSLVHKHPQFFYLLIFLSGCKSTNVNNKYHEKSKNKWKTAHPTDLQ